MDNSIFNNNFEDYQVLFQLLLAGKSIFYSDSIKTRVGNYISLLPNDKALHEFDKNIYKLVNDNYSEIRKLSDLIGYELIKDEHNLSISPDYKYFYYLIPIEGIIKNLPSHKLKRGDNLLIGVLSIETNMGTQFINYEEEFLKKMLEDPQNILKIDINLKDLSKIFLPNSKTSNTEKTMKSLKKNIHSRITSILHPNNYVQILKGYGKQNLISLGPAAFRFTKTLRQIVRKNENILNNSKSEVNDQ